MSDESFVLGLAIFFALVLRWAFQTLPQEKWQIMATIPVAKEEGNRWRGLNFTYYGFFSAAAIMVAAAITFILLGAIGVSATVTGIIMCMVLTVCLPASKFIARTVEKKPHTLTIGGASFVGFLVTPAILWIVDIASGWKNPVPMIPALASISISYGLGEGLGRLACISFGCCYGKPLSQCGPWIRRIVGRHPFVFSGKTKKIAYEGGLDGTEVIPIQAITAILHLAVSLAAIFLYLKGCYSAALILVIVTTQAWRPVSELLRADYRGGGKVSAYQIMSMAAIVYVFLLVGWSAPGRLIPAANLGMGIATLWDPAVILFLQALGWTGLLFSGRSMVTACTMSFHVVEDRV
ncbi:MAG: prolipoprotein diacylglyceryl transferase [Desulfomonilaceae bacterium]